MLKFPLALGVLLALATGAVAQTLPSNLPMAIMCYGPQDKSWHVGYLYRVNAKGEAIYLAVDGKIGTTVNAEGVVVAPTKRPATLDCYGKTLEELRSNGRVMEFQRTP